MTDKEPRIVDRTILRSITHTGEPCKMYIELVEAEDLEDTVIINKLILMNENGYYPGYRKLKMSNNKVLIQQMISFKIGTLSKIMNWVNNGVL
jgi:hypothetical protein